MAVLLNSRASDCTALCPPAQTFAWTTKYRCCWQCLYLVIALTALGPDFCLTPAAAATFSAVPPNLS